MRTRFRNSTARSALASLLALFAGTVAADTASELARDVLALDQQVHAVELTQADPQSSRLSVFVSARAPDYRLRRIGLKLDQQPMLNYEYSQPEWQALAAGSVHPAMSLALAPGEHRLQIELVARELDAKAGSTRVVQRLDHRFSSSGRETPIELSLVQASFGRERIEVRDWNQPATADDLRTPPSLRAAEFWLASGQPFQAAQLLLRAQLGNAGSDFVAQTANVQALSLNRIAGGSTQDLSNDPAIARHNAAVAALGVGNPQAELNLASLGDEELEDEAGLALRDRANLVLGYHHLRQGKGQAALEALGKVRSPGPHGNAALLAFGWAFLVSPTDPPEAATQGLAQPAFIAALASGTLPSEERRDRLQRALVPWTELIGRDPLDPAAQEGALALAWALDELGTGKQAHTYYQRAATQLELARAQLDAAMEHVGSGRAAQAIGEGLGDAQNGWRVWLADLPYKDETEYLKYLLTDARFVEALEPYRIAHRLAMEMESCTRRIEALSMMQDGRAVVLAAGLPALRQRVANHETGARRAMESVAQDWLRAQKAQAERYLVEARFAMARHFDRAPEIDLTDRKRATGAAS
ncbi:MAG: hypothetical protein ACT4QA_15055 [Panacagrimonas sp.]